MKRNMVFPLILCLTTLHAFAEESCKSDSQMPAEPAAYYELFVGVNGGPAYLAGSAVTIDGERASYNSNITVEEGKEFRIWYQGGIVSAKEKAEDDVKFRMGYKIDGVDRYLDMKLDTWIPKNTYNSIKGTLEVPDSKSGKMEVWFEAELPSKQIKYDSRYGANYPVNVISRQNRKTICFNSNYNNESKEALRPGDVLRLDYDVYRILGKLEGPSYNGIPAYQISAFAMFKGADGRVIETDEVPVHFRKYDNGTGKSSVKRLVPMIHIPSEAVSMELWFKGMGRGRPLYDSNFSRNYVYSIAK